MEHTGNPYPTHGLGPVCQILNIHRGDRLNYLVSMSTHQVGMTEYARRTFGKESPEAQQAYLLGDINTTLIHTVKGKTIQLQYCTVHPRPYSRSHTICGTRGFAQKYPDSHISLEDVRNGRGRQRNYRRTLATLSTSFYSYHRQRRSPQRCPERDELYHGLPPHLLPAPRAPWIWTSTMPPNGRASPSLVSNRY